MVKKRFINTVLKRLERYLIKKNDFRLNGDNYDLILFIPSDRYVSDVKYSLLISYYKLNNLNQKDIIKDLLNDFKNILNSDEYNAISRLNIIHSEDPFVKNLKSVFAFREQVTEINDVLIGGIHIDIAYLVKSLVLDKLITNQALTLEIINPSKIQQTINAGIIKIEENFDVVYYTGKGLREIWKPNMTEEQKENSVILKSKSEQYLISNEYISKINIDNILKVL